MHASGPRDYFSYHTKPCSLTISCCRSPLPSAFSITWWQQLVSSLRQSVGRSADVTLGALASHFGPGSPRVAASPSGHRLRNSGNDTLLFLLLLLLLLLPVTSACNLLIPATVTKIYIICLLYLFISNGFSNLGNGSPSAEPLTLSRVWTLRRDLFRCCCRCRPTRLNHKISPLDSHIVYERDFIF